MVSKKLGKEYFDNIRGAVYIPARAYNQYQMWKYYSEDEVKRDLQYAASLHINALRLWLNYEFWLENADAFQASFDNLIENASKAGIRIMPSLFEDCGRPNIPETYEDRNPVTATAFKSPGTAITSDPEKWGPCLEFVTWFMNRYANDERILAIEVMNEPHILPDSENLSFARAAFKRASELRGIIPLTIGCIAMVHNLYFIEYGLDILQFHDNFPQSIDSLETELHQAKETQKILGKPVWITEWQRIRESGQGWDVKEIPESDKDPKLASIAETVRKSGLGNFFWSLMLKPAYLPSQRLNGTFNGIFHEDGAVYSLEDARAVSGDNGFNVVERKSQPEWYL